MKNLAIAIVCFIAAVVVFIRFVEPNAKGVETTLTVLGAGSLFGIGLEHLFRFAERNQKP